VELAAVELVLKPLAETTVFHPSEMELGKVTQLLLEEAKTIRPKRLVFDSLSEFRLLAETPLRYRRELLRLKQEFAQYHSTVLLLDDKMDTSRMGADPHVLSITHGVIEMEQLSPDYGVSRRRFRVQKLRGVHFREGYHDYIIRKGGLRIFPRLVAAGQHAPYRRESVSSGVKEMDALFGGGLDRGTTTLILGQAGTGKSTIATQYAVQMATQGERSMIFAFDETKGLLLSRSAHLGMDLQKHMEAGIITVQQIDPAEISPGEFASRILHGVADGCRLVVIDSLNGYLNAMPGEKYLNNQLHELSAFLNQQGVVTILILAQHGLVAAAEAPVDLSYLADTVISARFFEAGGEVRIALAMLKKRSGRHEKTIREFRLDTNRGIHVGPPLKEFQGVLSGVPDFRGSVQKILREGNAPD
jgi:circadian clock protein KaiC